MSIPLSVASRHNQCWTESIPTARDLQDGVTYEREAIVAWLQRKSTSPMTNEPLLTSELHPNLLVQQMAAALGFHRRH